MYRYLHGHTDGLNSGEENIKINTWWHLPSEEVVSGSSGNKLFWKKTFA